MISNYINLKRLKIFAEQNTRTYVQNKPFPHIVVDNFLVEEVAIKLSQEFPQNIKNWRKRPNETFKNKRSFSLKEVLYKFLPISLIKRKNK
tara:strand:- start:1 stop:273 length:273 start_codon:yes stop_codon:yes gene_type:complete